MDREVLIQTLMQLQDSDYQAFQARLIPNIPAERIIGVRTPELRKLAKQLPEAESFLEALPHAYFEENQLHSFLLSEGKDFSRVIQEVDRFLPYVDNWATCDQLSPKVFKKHRQELLPYIEKWIESPEAYAVRFAIKMLMEHFLDADFSVCYPEMVAAVHREEYYIRMMAAWYFATALAKQYDAALPFLTDRKLEPWTHNKAIQKAIESYRITPEQKDFLKTLRIK